MAIVSVVSKVKSNTDDGYISLNGYLYGGKWYGYDNFAVFDSGQVTNKAGQGPYPSPTPMGFIYYYIPFWRFDQVDIPQGADIKSAKIRLKRSTWTDSDGYPDLKSSFSIKMLASDNANKQVANFAKGTSVSAKAARYAKVATTSVAEPTYPGVPNGWTQMPPTVFGSNSVVWDVAADTTTIDTWVDSPDITDVVKEVVDRAGWVADNAMGLYFCLPDLAVVADADTTGWVREFHSYGATGNPGAELHIEYKVSTPEVVHIPARPVATSPATSATSTGGGDPFVPGVDPPDRVSGLQAWYSAESLSASLADGASVTSWSTKSGQTLDLTPGGVDKPTYEDVSFPPTAYPVVDLSATTANYGLLNTTTDARFLCPGANEAMITAVHWRPSDINDVNFIQTVGYGSGTKNCGASGYRGWEWMPVGSGGQMRFRARGSDDALLELDVKPPLVASEDCIMLVVRDMASQQLRMFIDGGNAYFNVDCANSVDFKHSTDDAEICIGNYVGAANLDDAALGYLGESLTYVRDTDFTANDINTIGAYLARRYGVLWHNIYQVGVSPTLGYTTGLAARYKAVGDATHMTLNGTDVDVWKDISDNDRHLYPYDLNGVTADPPTFDDNGWTSKFTYNSSYNYYTNVGGFRAGCVDFDGVQCMFEDAATEADIEVPYTLIAVCQPPASYAAKCTLYSGFSAQRGVEIDASVTRKWSMTNDTLAATGEYCRPAIFDNGVPAYYAYISQGNNSVAFVYGDGVNSKFYDNGEVKESTLDAGTEDSIKIIIGGNDHATSLEPWHGKVCEILIYDHEVSAANIKAIHDDYLAKEWGCRQPYTNYNDV